MISRRKLLFALGAGAIAAPLESLAQQSSARNPRIGFLGFASAASDAASVEALRIGLRELGYVEGRNIVIEFRWADGKNDLLPALAAGLVRLKVDLIVASGTRPVQVAMQATTTIPIVMASAGDPIRSGLVASLARPGGNVTGLTQLGAELAGKRLELLKNTLPNASRVAFLWNPLNASHIPYRKEIQAAARALRLTLLSVEVRSEQEFESAFAGMMRQRPDALIMTSDSVHRLRLAWIVEFAAKRRLPAMYQVTDYVEAGGLMSYGANRPALFRHTARYIDKILKGAKPADLPVEQPTIFELVINLKTARALGIVIPQSVLLRADRVIE
jgi:putative ABC transport system substrate-binding protein